MNLPQNMIYIRETNRLCLIFSFKPFAHKTIVAIKMQWLILNMAEFDHHIGFEIKFRRQLVLNDSVKQFCFSC